LFQGVVKLNGFSIDPHSLISAFPDGTYRTYARYWNKEDPEIFKTIAFMEMTGTTDGYTDF